MDIIPETIGTLDLKIARLERQLQILQHQQLLSSIYPEHQLLLAEKIWATKAELNQLSQRRERLLGQPGKGFFDDDYHQGKTVYATH